MYNIITFKGELMKKLLILTVLLSAANLGAFTAEEAQGRMTAAQQSYHQALARAKENDAGIKQLHALSQQKPGAESLAALQAAIANANESCDQCRQHVHGVQKTLNEINARHHFVHGDAWTGRVATISHTPMA